MSPWGSIQKADPNREAVRECRSLVALDANIVDSAMLEQRLHAGIADIGSEAGSKRKREVLKYE